MITIRVAQGDIAGFARKAIIVNLFEGVTTPGGGTGAVDAALEGGISRLISDGDCTGKYGEITVLHTLGRLNAPRVVILGLGKANEFNYHKVRDLTAQVLRHLRGLGIDEAATITHGAGIGGLDPEACAQAMAEGAVMGLYRFDRHRSKDTGIVEFQQLAIVEQDRDRADDLRRGVERGMVLAEAVNVARDMANEPANYLTPTELARRALQMAEELGLTCQIFEREDMVRMGMGGVLGVACVEYGGLLLAGPHAPLLRRFYTIREQLWQLAAGADPYRGRALRSLLQSSGFERVVASSKYFCYGTAAAVQAFGTGRAADCRDDWYTSAAQQYGLASSRELAAMEQAWLEWSVSPAAYAAFAWCRALGWKPQEERRE